MAEGGHMDLEPSRANILKRNNKLLGSMVKVDNKLLTYLEQKHVIQPYFKKVLEGKTDNATRMDFLVRHLRNSSQDSYLGFCEVLEDEGYQDLVDEILTKQDNVRTLGDASASTYIDRDSEILLKVQGYKPQIITKVHPKKIIADLQQEGILKAEDVAEINNKSSKQDQVRAVLQKVADLGYDAYQALFRSMEKNGYSQLVKKIHQTVVGDAGPLNRIPRDNLDMAIRIRLMRNPQSVKPTIMNMPTEIINSVFKPKKKASKYNLIATIEREYGVKRKSIHKDPLTLVLIPAGDNPEIKQLRADCQSGQLAAKIWEKIAAKPFFEGTTDKWEVILDVDLDELSQVSEHLATDAEKEEPVFWKLEEGHTSQGDSDDEDDDDDDDEDDDDDSDDEDDDDEDEDEDAGDVQQPDMDEDDERFEDAPTDVPPAPVECTCSGDGACQMVLLPTNPISGPQKRAKEETILNIGTEYIRKHVLVGRSKHYNYKYKHFLNLLQGNRKEIGLANLKGKDGCTFLHLATLNNRKDYIRAIYDAGLLPDMYYVKVQGEQSSPSVRDQTALELASKFKMLQVWEDLQRYMRIEETFSWAHRLARLGLDSRLDALLERHPHLINAQAKDLSTPLYWAVTSGSEACIRVLLSRGANKDCRTDNGDTLLTRLASVGHRHLVPLLLNSLGLDPNLPGLDNKVPAHVAIEYRDVEMVRTLIEHGARVSESSLPQIVKTGDVKFFSFLHETFRFDLDARDSRGKTALFYTVEHGYRSTLNFLIANRVDIMARDKKMKTVLHCAVESGQKETLDAVVRELQKWNKLGDLLNERDRYLGVERCFLVRGRDKGLLAYHYVEVDRGYLHIFKEITRGGGSVDVIKYGKVLKSGWGANPTPEATREVDARYDVETAVSATSPPDLTPLSQAILREQPHMALELLKLNPDVTTPDCFGLTPLHLAAMRGNLDVVKALVERGADLEALDQKQRLPRDLAEANAHHRVTHYFKSRVFVKHLGVQDFVKKLELTREELNRLSLEKVRDNGDDVRTYIIQKLRYLEEEIATQLYDLGSAPIMAESQESANQPQVFQVTMD